MELFHANRQWATRPEDERFLTLEAMHAATKAHADAARVQRVEWSDVKLVPSGGENVSIVGTSGVPAPLTNYAFGQLAGLAGAPTSYLRDLPATLAAENLNHGLRTKVGGSANFLFHQNGGGLVLRAANTEIYSRLWDYQVIERLVDLSARHDLEPAGQTFNWGSDAFTPNADAPKALFASNHDMFAFLKSRERAIVDPTGKAHLFRGVIVSNSEVGDKALTIMGFNFRDVCCNFIIWGATELATVRFAHVGEIGRKWDEALVQVRRYFDADTSFEKARFEQVTKRIAGTKEELLDVLFGKKSTLGLTRKALTASYDAVVPDEDGDPLTAWGFAQGVTRHSQTVKYADERTELDRAAGKLLDFKF